MSRIIKIFQNGPEVSLRSNFATGYSRKGLKNGTIRKSPRMTSLLEKMFGRTSSIVANKCIKPPLGCGEKITGFNDSLSEKEYKISGLCQDCQNKVFGKYIFLRIFLI